MSAAGATFSVDATGFTSGAGTWSLGVSGLNLVLSYSAGDPYTNWATTNITNIQPAAPAGFDQDADGDGVKNGLVFILGGNPLVPNSSTLPSISLDPTNLTFSYTRSTDSVDQHHPDRRMVHRPRELES